MFRALKYRNFKLFFTGQSISLIGTWIQMIALSWLVYDMTHSTFMLGLVGFISRIPSLLFAPIAGVFADRMNKYKLLYLTQILAMVQAAIITILLFTNTIEIWHIIVLGIFLGIINSFDMPVRQSFVIELIEDKEDLSNAIALNSAMVNGARLIGPTIAGVLIAAFGESWCFLLNSLSFIAILLTLSFMKIPKSFREKKSESHMKKLKDGFKYAYDFLPIRYILLLLSLISLMGMPFQILMPYFAKDVFHGGPNALGFLMAATGVGALIGALYLAYRKSVLGLGKNLIYASLIFGGGLIIFSFSGNLWLSLVILVFTGFGMMVEITASNTLLQTLSEDDKRGRVMSFYTLAFMGTVPLGNLLTGFLSDLIGVQYTILFGGVSCIIGAILFAFKLPEIRKYSRPVYIEKEIIILEE
ncbi:MAG TPA: MFS transporter [Ignavibacteria bacterium]